MRHALEFRAAATMYAKKSDEGTLNPELSEYLICALGNIKPFSGNIQHQNPEGQAREALGTGQLMY